MLIESGHKPAWVATTPEKFAKGKVDVTVVEGEDKTVLELRVAESDMGKVIGRQGRIAKAIRTVIRSATTQSPKKVVVDIL